MPYPFQSTEEISLESLKRTLEGGLRQRVVIDDGGRVSHMVWIPKFTIPQGLFKSGDVDEWPDAPLDVGGFFIDQFACAKSDATHSAAGSGSVAVSVPGVVAWTNLTHDAARTALAGREVNGVKCRLPFAEEWIAVTIIGRLLDQPLRGNTNAGRDARDTDTAGNRGVSDPTNAGATLTGAGPQSWNLSGLPSGPADILGNIYEWINEEVPACRATVFGSAQLDDAGGIALTDLQLTMDGLDEPEMWPATDGVITMEDAGNPGTYEIIKYATFSDNGDDTYTLGGLTRGHRGTTAVNHADNNAIQLLSEFCILPQSSSFLVTGLNNTTDPVTFTVHDIVDGYDNVGVQVGDVIQVEAEQLDVTAVVGDQVTADRGHNSTTPATHADWTRAVTHPHSITLGGTAADPTIIKFFDSFTNGGELQYWGLPSTVQAVQANADAGDQFSMRLRGGVMCRGGYHGSGSAVENGWELLITDSGNAFAFIGFRGVLSVEE